jgi:hypothetical protein
MRYDPSTGSTSCKRGIDRWLSGRLSLDTLIGNLAQEWASTPKPDGKGHYAGQNAGVSVSQVKAALAEVARRHAEGQPKQTVEVPVAVNQPYVPPTIEKAVKKQTKGWGWSGIGLGDAGAALTAIAGWPWQTICAVCGPRRCRRPSCPRHRTLDCSAGQGDPGRGHGLMFDWLKIGAGAALGALVASGPAYLYGADTAASKPLWPRWNCPLKPSAKGTISMLRSLPRMLSICAGISGCQSMTPQGACDGWQRLTPSLETSVTILKTDRPFSNQVAAHYRFGKSQGCW